MCQTAVDARRKTGRSEVLLCHVSPVASLAIAVFWSLRQEPTPAASPQCWSRVPRHALVVVRAGEGNNYPAPGSRSVQAAPPRALEQHPPIIVDPGFRDAFAVARPTPRFADLLSEIPEVFVGDAAKLRAVVTLVAAALEQSFAARGLPLPPWRTRAALLARWGLAGPRRAWAGKLTGQVPTLPTSTAAPPPAALRPALLAGSRVGPLGALGAGLACPQLCRGPAECDEAPRWRSPSQLRRG